MNKFKVGDIVQWASQSHGTIKVKVGKIVVVVPEKEWGERNVPVGFSMRPSGFSRNHESYLVQVGTSTVLSWPLVKHLSIFDGKEIVGKQEAVNRSLWNLQKIAKGQVALLNCDIQDKDLLMELIEFCKRYNRSAKCSA